MEKFATNKNGNIDSGTEVLANNVVFLQQAKELAISNLFGDLFVEGILNTGNANTMFPITANADGTFNVGQGLAYKRNVSVEPMIYERIEIKDTTEEYNSANPTQTTFDGVDQNVITPKSTGCKNITIPNANITYYVDLRYLCVCDNGNNGNGLGLTNYSLAKQDYPSSTERRKRFYKWIDGYEIVLVQSTAEIQGICLGSVSKNNNDEITITEDFKTGHLLIESRVIMDYFVEGQGIIIETINQGTTNEQAVLSINVDDITTEIDEENHVRVTKDGLYPYTKFSVNSGHVNGSSEPEVVKVESVSIFLEFGGIPGTPLVVSPAYNDRYTVVFDTGVTNINNVITSIQSYYYEIANGEYIVCINNTSKEVNNEPLDVPILEIMKKIIVSTKQPNSFSKGTIWYDTNSEPCHAKWYDGSSWKEYHGVPLAKFVVDGSNITKFENFEFNLNRYNISKPNSLIGLTPYMLENLIQGTKAQITGGFDFPIVVIINCGADDGGARLWINSSNDFGSYDSSFDGTYSNARKVWSYASNDAGEGAGVVVLDRGMYFSATGRHLQGVWYAPLYQVATTTN